MLRWDLVYVSAAVSKGAGWGGGGAPRKQKVPEGGQDKHKVAAKRQSFPLKCEEYSWENKESKLRSIRSGGDCPRARNLLKI